MNKEFSNTWAVILGGSSGLGLASAKKLAAHGMNICIVHRDRKSEIASFTSELEGIRALGVKAEAFNRDALKLETIDEVVALLPRHSVGVLLHSIAKGSVKPLLAEADALTKDDYSITINAMALSWLDWTQAFISNELFASNARNVAFTSEGNTKALRHYGAVSAAKATLEALMRQMAVEYAPLGMTNNCIQAGVTRTKSFDRIPGSDQISKFAQQRNPYQRLTSPEDVANAVYLLCREEARWINGTVLKVDGGESLR